MHTSILKTALFASVKQPIWTNAIRKAMAIADDITRYEFSGEEMIITSSSGGGYHVSTGVCQCKAFRCGQPCYHRALRGLLIGAQRGVGESTYSDATDAEIWAAWSGEYPRLSLPADEPAADRTCEECGSLAEHPTWCARCEEAEPADQPAAEAEPAPRLWRGPYKVLTTRIKRGDYEATIYDGEGYECSTIFCTTRAKAEEEARQYIREAKR